MDASTAPQAAASVPEGYMRNSKGHLVPVQLVGEVDKLQDQLVQKMMAYADELSGQVARFKGHCFDDVGAFLALLAEKYDAKRGGRKGNMTFLSFDGLARVQVAVAERIVFGPELQIARDLIEECLGDWAEGSRAELRVLIDQAFQVDKEGKVSSEAIFRLRRTAIDDPRWKRAMEAIGDSIRVVGSKAYVRFYRRPSTDAAWQAVTIDLASA